MKTLLIYTLISVLASVAVTSKSLAAPEPSKQEVLECTIKLGGLQTMGTLVTSKIVNTVKETERVTVKDYNKMDNLFIRFTGTVAGVYSEDLYCLKDTSKNLMTKCQKPSWFETAWQKKDQSKLYYFLKAGTVSKAYKVDFSLDTVVASKPNKWRCKDF